MKDRRERGLPQPVTGTWDDQAEATVGPYAAWEEENANRGLTASADDGSGPSAYREQGYDAEATVSPYSAYGRAVVPHDQEATANSYDEDGRANASFVPEKSANPYGAYGQAEYDPEATVNPYGAYGQAEYDPEATVNPYSAYGQAAYDPEATVNPYGAYGQAAYDPEATVNPYGAQGQAAYDPEATVNPYGAQTQKGMDMRDGEEATVNPYEIDWMPRIAVEWEIEQHGQTTRRRTAFMGSMWIGATARCEIQVDADDGGYPCAELISAGSRLYIRNISRSGESVLFEGSALGGELTPVQEGSTLTIGAVRLTAVAIG